MVDPYPEDQFMLMT